MAAPTLTTRTPDPAAALRSLFAPGNVVLVGAVLLTCALTALVAQQGLTLRTVAPFGLLVFVAIVAGFLTVPWLMVPATIVLFTVLPTLRVFAGSRAGAAKDLISLAALSAAGLAVLRRRAGRAPTQLDVPCVLFVAMLLLLYVVNTGGLLTGETGHGIAWFQGARLFLEPLSLLIVGMALRDPRRTLRAGTRALILGAVGAAAWGILQQSLGVNRLLSLGYRYGVEVRQINGHLRSFGTLGEPFAFASFLLLAVSAIMLAGRIRRRSLVALGVLILGLLFSYVRTAAFIGLAVAGLALARRGRAQAAALLFGVAIVAAAAVFVISSEAHATRSVPVNTTTYITLNGRAKVWREQLGKPGDWLFGRGVGAVGTAAVRARETLSGKRQVGTQSTATTVDSGYLALVADIGLAGLVLLLGLVARIVSLARRAMATDPDTAWLSLGLLTVMLIDALSRESFTAFPSGYVGMMLVGLCISAARVPVGQPSTTRR
jgi:hypothetical protein